MSHSYLHSKLYHGGALVFLSLLFQCGCYRAYPPKKPEGVPVEAIWAGGVDGGGWVHCSTSSPEFNTCEIYDEEGRSSGPARYALRKGGGAAKPEQLKYTYLTGEAIGLEGGLELARINYTK